MTVPYGTVSIYNCKIYNITCSNIRQLLHFIIYKENLKTNEKTLKYYVCTLIYTYKSITSKMFDL